MIHREHDPNYDFEARTEHQRFWHVRHHHGRGWHPSWASAYEPFGAGEITIQTKGKKKDSPEVIALKQAAIAARKEVDERILANLLRLNLERSRQSP